MSSYNESKEYLENGLCPECKTKLELMPSSGGRPYYTPELYCDYCCITWYPCEDPFNISVDKVMTMCSK